MRVGRAVSKEEGKKENTRQFSLYGKYMVIGWWVLLGGCGGVGRSLTRRPLQSVPLGKLLNPKLTLRYVLECLCVCEY